MQGYQTVGRKREYAHLTTRGRKTGLPHVVELRYVTIDGSFYVMSDNPRSDWFLNSIQTDHCTLRVGDLLFETVATPAGDMERDRAVGEFQKRYGRRLVKQWYGSGHACLRLTPIGPPAVRGSATGELESKTSLEDWKRTGSDYYADVAAAFDSASEEYDFTISHNFINTWIRRRSIDVLARLVTPDDYLLEVGCGTGAESLEVSKLVKGIIALDVSQRMVDLLSAKVKARNLQGKIIPVRLAASDLFAVRELKRDQSIRVAYSFNGALNCEPKIKEFVAQLHDTLEPGGLFVCSIRNTLCLTEVVTHILALQFGKAFPRKKQPIMVSVGGRDIPSTYYPPWTFAEFFKPMFRVKETIALPGLLPPAYLNEYYLKLRTITSILERMDERLSGRFPLNQFGDQTLFVFQRNGRGHEGVGAH